MSIMYKVIILKGVRRSKLKFAAMFSLWKLIIFNFLFSIKGTCVFMLIQKQWRDDLN